MPDKEPGTREACGVGGRFKKQTVITKGDVPAKW